MKGLLVKDYEILKNQGRVIFMLVAVSLFLGFTSEESSFVIGYCTFCLSALVTTTVSYDDLDNGYSFLFTLPVTRKLYVLEKYLLALIICTGAAAFSTVMGILMTLVKGGEIDAVNHLVTAVVVAFVGLLMVSVMLPVQMKFGAEKSRIILFGFVGGILLIGAVVGFLIDKLQSVITIDVESILSALESLGAGVLVAIMLLAVLVIIGVTMLISIRIMEKKEM